MRTGFLDQSTNLGCEISYSTVKGSLGIDGIGRAGRDDLAAEAVGQGHQLCDIFPFVARGLMEGEAKEEFVVAAHRVFYFCVEGAFGVDGGIDGHALCRGEWQLARDRCPARCADARRAQHQRFFAAKVWANHSKRRYLEIRIEIDGALALVDRKDYLRKKRRARELFFRGVGRRNEECLYRFCSRRKRGVQRDLVFG